MIPGYSLLLDTHVVIWMATKPDRLPTSLLEAIQQVSTRLVSHATAWEIQIKHEKHGSRFPFSLQQLEQTMKAFSCTELAIEYKDIRKLNQLRFLHTDPFDRMLMAQASGRPVYLATLDQDIVNTFETGQAFHLFTDRAREQRASTKFSN